MSKQFIAHIFKKRVAYILSVFLTVLGLTLFLAYNSYAAVVSNVVLSDTDTTGYGLDGRDFRIVWDIGTSTPAGFQYTKVFITSSTIVLTTSTLDSACGMACIPVAVFNQYNATSTVLPQSIVVDSAMNPWTTSTPYVAWVYVQADIPTIVSSSPVTTTFDVVADTNAPQIDHMGVHTARSAVPAVINAFVIDDQTSATQFGNTGDGGSEYFKLYYGTNPTVSVTEVDGVAVSGATGLFSFTIPTSSVVNQLKYYLIARDSSNNARYFCATGFASAESTCKSNPFTITTTTSAGRSVSGKITSNGSNVSGAVVFPGGFAKAAVQTDASGDYTVSGLPDNNTFNFTSNKTNFIKGYRLETIGTSNKTGVDMSIPPGTLTYVVNTGDPGSAGGAPKVVFSGPPDGMQNFPTDQKIRVGFDQSLNASTVSDADPTDSGSNVYLAKNDGTKIAGSVTYCSNNATPGCSALFSIDNNVILFSPSANLATGTFYTLVMTEGVKSNSGQSIAGNRAGGGHKISFTTMGNSFSISQTDTATWQTNFNQGGQYLPPFVKSMVPAPGMTAAPNVNILLEFNQAMDTNSINTTNITLWKNNTQISSGVSVSLDSNEKRFVTITHNYASDGTGEYEVKVKGSVSSASGIPMRAGDTSVIAFSSKFNVSGSNDATAPTIYPVLADNSTGVATNKIFEFGLSEQLAFSTVNNNNIVLGRGSSNESLYTRYDPAKNSIYVVPTSVLIPNTIYSVMLKAGITDLAGNAIATTSYTYTTGATDAVAPGIKEARCDDYTCKITFNEPMNHDSQSDSKWAASVLNPTNWAVKKTAPTLSILNVSAKPINYDAVKNIVTIEGLAGLTAGDSFMVTTSVAVTDISDNLIDSGSNLNQFSGKVEDSKSTFGTMGEVSMFAPPTTGMTGGTIGGAEFKPQGFGSFTADQFALGQADMAFPFNPMAGIDSNVFQIRFTPGVAVQTGDIVTLTFPDGFNVANATLDAQSPFYSDFNQFMTGSVSSTDISVANGLNQISVTLGVSGSLSANDPLTIDLKKIINSSVPKSPQTGGYTVGIKIYRSTAAIATKTTMPFFIMTAGSNTLVVDVVAGTATSSPGINGANGTVYIHGGGPGGPMDKKLTLTNGDISAVDGASGTSVSYSSLPDGCYFVGTDPFVTLGSNDYFGQMSPEPVCLSSGETKTKWLLLTSASGGSTATLTVKMVDSNGSPYNFGGKDIDIFAGGPNKFVVKNLTGVTTAATNGYAIKLNANGHWFVGMGPGMPKGASTAKPTSLGVMPPPPVDILVQNIESSPSLSLGTGNPPPGVSYSNGVITFSFATADKTVTGTVKDGSGNALANVEVFMHRQGFGAPVFTQTNASGVFSLSVSNFGSYEIGAMSDGMPPVVKNIELRSDNKIYVDGKDVTGNFILNLKKASYTISGKVLNGSNNGIAYAPVMGVDANGNNVFGQSSSDGSYTLFVDNGTWTVRAELPPSKTDSCGSFSKTVTVSGSSQANQNLTSSASSCYTLSGTISVGVTALANIPVFIEQWNNITGKPTVGGERKNVSTDSNGAYSVKVAGDTAYRVATWHSDYGELSVTTTVAGNTAQNITVATTEDIIFNFTGGTSAMNAFIELKNSGDDNKRISKQLTGLNNSTTFSVPAGSTYSYFLDVFGVGKFQGTVAASSTETVNLGVVSGNYITVTGTIYVGSNTTTGQSGALVTFVNATTTVSAVTDSNGQYSVKLKAGTYNISDSLFGYMPTKGTSVSFTTNTSAYDFGGSNPDQSALETAGNNIEGTIYASDGSTAMTDGYVWGTNASGTIVTAQVKSTDGTYSLPVTNGIWTIRAVGPRHVETLRSGTVTVSGSNQTAKNITLTAASSGENVPTSTAGVISADTGGSLNDSGGSGMKLTAGAGVLETGSSEVTVNFEKNYTAPDTSNYGALGNASFSISASGDSTIKNLSGNAEIQIDYTSLVSSLPAGISESDLKLTYYSEEKGDYVPVEGGFTIDTSTNKITGLVNHFTDFVIAYTATSSNVPSAPTGLSATAASASQIDLSWTAISGVTSYTVYRSSDNVTYSSIATASTNNYSNTGLSGGTLYYYKVTASNSFGEGSSSDAASATTNSAGGGSSGSAGGSSYLPVATSTVSATTTPVTSTTTPSVTSTVSSATSSVSAGTASTTVNVGEKKPAAEVIKTAGVITVLNPQSKIVITLPKSVSYQPGAQLAFVYQYKNESAKKIGVKIIRQLLDSKGKVVSTASLSKILKSKAVFVGKPKENLLKNLKPGEYTVKIMILGVKNKVIDQNSFKIEIEKAKQKYFIFDTKLPEATDIAFDEEFFAKVKSDVKLPTQLKLKYRYANNSDVKQKVKMVRQLIGPSGKVVQTNTGNWSMESGEEDEQTFTQPIVPNFSVGAYKIRIRAYNFKTQELLAENSVGFSVELK
jgi:hypothetical protein